MLVSPSSPKTLAERAHRRGIRTPHFWPSGADTDTVAQEMVLGWAEACRVRLSSKSDGCLHWLAKGHCRLWECGEQLGHGGLNVEWADHVSYWLHDGRPAVIAAHPYHLTATGLRVLAAIDQHDALTVRMSGTHWYGHRTIFVEVWNREVLDAVNGRRVRSLHNSIVRPSGPLPFNNKEM